MTAQNSTDCEICEVVNSNEDCSATQIKKRIKRTLHFSDGALEEYSSEDETDNVAQHKTEVNPATLMWKPWLWHQTILAGRTILGACDSLGETLAKFFGIVTPKYQAEIDYFKEIQAEEEAMQKKEDLEMGSWKTKASSSVISAEIGNN